MWRGFCGSPDAPTSCKPRTRLLTFRVYLPWPCSPQCQQWAPSPGSEVARCFRGVPPPSGALLPILTLLDSPLRPRLIPEALTDLRFYATLVAILAAVSIALLTNRRKKLFFDVVCEALLLDFKPTNTPEANENKESHPTSGDEYVLFIVDLHNAIGTFVGGLGSIDISPSRYERNISISFGNKARILEASIVEEDPTNIGEEIIQGTPLGQRLTLKPVLLNQGDWIRVRALVQNPEVNPSHGRRKWILRDENVFAVDVEGRIKGIRSFQRKLGKNELLQLTFAAFIVALLPEGISTILTIIGSLADNPNLSYVTARYIPLFGAQVALMIISIFSSSLFIRRVNRTRNVVAKYAPEGTRVLVA